MAKWLKQQLCQQQLRKLQTRQQHQLQLLKSKTERETANADNNRSNIGWYDCDNRNDDCSNRDAAVAQW